MAGEDEGQRLSVLGLEHELTDADETMNNDPVSVRAAFNPISISICHEPGRRLTFLERH